MITPARPATVLLVAPMPPPRGGIGTWTESLLAWAAGREDVSIDLVDTAPRWRPVHDVRRWRRVTLGTGQAWRDLRGVAGSIARRRPDVMHLATSGGLALARDACLLSLARWKGVPTVYHLHLGWLPDTRARGGLEHAGFGLTLRLCDTAITLDQASARAARAIAPKTRAVVVPNFIDAAGWTRPMTGPSAGSASRPVRVLYVGWLNEMKGLRELVQACAAMAGKHEFELTIAGPGDPAFKTALAAEAGPACGWLRILGELPRDAVKSAMANADVFVLPSRSEGFPYVLLEAMSAGLAIVATRVGAIPEMLGDGDDGAGVTVPPRDAAALERALDGLMADGEWRAELGRRAREAVERHFSAERVCGRYAQLWAGAPATRGAEA